MKTFVERRDDVVIVCFDGILGFDKEDFEVMGNVDDAIRKAAEGGSTRFVVDLTKAAAGYPSSIGLLFRPFRELLRSGRARVAVVGSGVPTRSDFLTPEMLTTMGLNNAFYIVRTVEEAIQSLSVPPETTSSE